jgi:hypothetical protein
MANRRANTLTISGPDEEIRSFERRVNDGASLLTFTAHVPEPAAWPPTMAAKVLSSWHSWRLASWGCKDGASRVTTTACEQGVVVRYRFETPWVAATCLACGRRSSPSRARIHARLRRYPASVRRQRPRLWRRPSVGRKRRRSNSELIRLTRLWKPSRC